MSSHMPALCAHLHISITDIIIFFHSLFTAPDLQPEAAPAAAAAERFVSWRLAETETETETED